MAIRVLKLLVGVGVVGGGLAASHRSDGEILAKVATTAVSKLHAAAPNPALLTTPLASLRPSRVLPIEDRVRLRLDSDTHLTSVTVDVRTGSAVGEIILRGFVQTPEQRLRAAALTESTIGVTRVINEIAVLE
jgi:hypothetical protein